MTQLLLQCDRLPPVRVSRCCCALVCGDMSQSMLLPCCALLAIWTWACKNESPELRRAPGCTTTPSHSMNTSGVLPFESGIMRLLPVVRLVQACLPLLFHSSKSSSKTTALMPCCSAASTAVILEQFCTAMQKAQKLCWQARSRD